MGKVEPGMHDFPNILRYAGGRGGLSGKVGRSEDNEEQFEEVSGAPCGCGVGGG